MDITTFSTLDLQEQGRKSYICSYVASYWAIVIEGDSRKISSANDSQYTIYKDVCFEALINPKLLQNWLNGKEKKYKQLSF